MNIQLNKKKLTLIGQRVRIELPQHCLLNNKVGTVLSDTVGKYELGADIYTVELEDGSFAEIHRDYLECQE